MKNVIKVLVAISLIAVMLVSLVACGNKPSGEYGNDVVTATFKGNEVTVTFKVLLISSTVNGTFKMGEDNQILITYEDEEEAKSAPSGWTYDKENDAIECNFGIGKITLEKKDK